MTEAQGEAELFYFYRKRNCNWDMCGSLFFHLKKEGMNERSWTLRSFVPGRRSHSKTKTNLLFVRFLFSIAFRQKSFDDFYLFSIFSLMEAGERPISDRSERKSLLSVLCSHHENQFGERKRSQKDQRQFPASVQPLTAA